MAACISDSRVALYSNPGSRNRTETSISPGQTIKPLASSTRSARQPSGASPFASTFPAATNSDVLPSTSFFGSMTLPLRISIFIAKRQWTVFVFLAGCQHAHDRHSHRNAEGHLGKDHRVLAVGDGGVDFHPAIHGSRVHHDRVRLGEREFVLGETVVLEKFPSRWQQRALHALALQSEHDDNVSAA